jgi:hypothetical protein
MNQTEKDKLVGVFMIEFNKLSTLPVEAQPLQYLRILGDFFELIHHKAREEGFNEGFAECKRQIEKKYSQLN